MVREAVQSEGLFARITNFFGAVSTSMQMPELPAFVDFNKKNTVLEFPSNNVLTYRGPKDVAVHLDKDLALAYTHHKDVRALVTQNVNNLASCQAELARVLHESPNPVDALIGMLLVVAKERRERDVTFLLHYDLPGVDRFHESFLSALQHKMLRSGLTVLHHLVLSTRDNRAVLKLILNADQHGSLLEKRSLERQMTPLMTAALVGSTWAIPLLLEAGASVNLNDRDGNTLLHLASASMKDGVSGVNVLDLLFADNSRAMKSQINIENIAGHTAVSLAAAHGDDKALKCLLQNGANPNPDRFSPLCYATVGGHAHCVRLLVAKNANVNVRNKNGESPLSIAVVGGSLDCLKHLLSAEIDIPLVENALKQALETRQLQLAYLIAYKKVYSGIDFRAPLMLAVGLDVESLDARSQGLYKDILQLFIRNHALDNNALEILRYAAKKDNEVAYKLLVNGGHKWKKDELQIITDLGVNKKLVGIVAKKIRQETISCVCCFEEPTQMVQFSPCDHVQCCTGCFEELKKTGDDVRCPMCREELNVDKCKVVETN